MKTLKTNGLADLSTALNELIRDDKIIKQKIKRIIGDRPPPDCPVPVHYDYKSGAVYDGEAVELIKCGKGKFSWPNGDQYTGDYQNNQRHGYGLQAWNDGSMYEGHFENDKKAGEGVYKWTNKEVSCRSRYLKGIALCLWRGFVSQGVQWHLVGWLSPRDRQIRVGRCIFLLRNVLREHQRRIR
jgi:hypothetical protein